MKDKIIDYDFVDCLLIDFGVDRLISTLFLIVEAYYPASSSELRKKGLIKLFFSHIYKIDITKNEEFEFDVSLTYDNDGNDYKANEIYSIEILDTSDGNKKTIIDSDMLKMIIESRDLSIVEL